MARLFMRMLDRVLRRRYAVIGGTVALFVAALIGMKFVQQQFFPSSDRPELLVDLTLPQGSSLGATRKTVEDLEKILKADADIEHWSFYVGSGAIRFYLPLDQQLAGLEVRGHQPSALHVGGEQEYPVRPLAVGSGSPETASASRPDLDAATSLFIDRARAVRPDGSPARTCRSCRDLRAARRVAAGHRAGGGRLSLLPPAAIRDSLAAHLPARFGTARRPGAPADARGCDRLES